MKYIKLFEYNGNTNWESIGNPLGDKAMSILIRENGSPTLKDIEIRVDDHIYYVRVSRSKTIWWGDPYFYHTFETFGELREYVRFRYFMKGNRGEDKLMEFLEKASTSYIVMDGGILFRQACRFGYAKIVKAILKNGYNIDQLIRKAIGDASKSNHLEVLDLLLSDIRSRGRLSYRELQKYMSKLDKVVPSWDSERLFSCIRGRILKNDALCLDYYDLGICKYLRQFITCYELNIPLHEIIEKTPEVFEGKEIVISMDFDSYDIKLIEKLLDILKSRRQPTLTHLTIVSKSKPTEINGVFIFKHTKMNGYNVTSYWGNKPSR